MSSGLFLLLHGQCQVYILLYMGFMVCDNSQLADQSCIRHGFVLQMLSILQNFNLFDCC